MRIVFAVTCLFSTCIGTLLGQETHGTMAGRLMDAAGQPLEGATITVSSPALQGERGAVTNAQGRFHLPSLPPGTYSMTVERIGFRTMVMEEIPILLGRTTGLEEIRLEEAPVELDPLVVTADQVTH